MVQQEMRRADDPWRADITQRMNVLETTLAQNTATTNEIKSNTDEIVQFFKAGKGFFTMMGYFGKVLKWCGAVAAAVTAVWAAREIGK